MVIGTVVVVTIRGAVVVDAGGTVPCGAVPGTVVNGVVPTVVVGAIVVVVVVAGGW